MCGGVSSQTAGGGKGCALGAQDGTASAVADEMSAGTDGEVARVVHDVAAHPLRAAQVVVGHLRGAADGHAGLHRLCMPDHHSNRHEGTRHPIQR